MPLLQKYLKYYRLLPLLIAVLLLGCDPTEPDPQQLVESAIKAHGHTGYQKGVISFRSGGALYRVLRHDDAFVYSRTFQDAGGQRVHDVVQNSGFTRTVDGQEVELSQVMENEVAASVSKEIFLALLPNNLNNTVAEQKYEGNNRLRGEMYHKIRFRIPPVRDIAGERVELVGWFHEKRHTLDYVAYEPEEKGAGRFWEAKNTRTVGGIRFQDYNTYSTADRISLEKLDYAFELGKLEKRSEINLEEVKVMELPEI